MIDDLINQLKGSTYFTKFNLIFCYQVKKFEEIREMQN